MKSVLVTGAGGQLGQALKEIESEYSTLDFFFASRDILDITDQQNLADFFSKYKFDVVVNCAAYTAVDKAETEIDTARLINAIATKYLAQITAKYNIPLVHLSTDYVFDGISPTPRTEINEVNPIGVYGQTKFEGEQFALANNPKTIVIRTSWVYSKYGVNFVKTMLRLFSEKQEIGVINDQKGSPTNAIDLARAIATIISRETYEYGIFNYSNEGECSWYDFAMKIREFTGSSILINPIPTSAYPTPAKRPAYSLLDKSKIKKIYHLNIPYWEESLKRELKTLI